MQHLIAKRGIGHLVSCDSAGTAGYHTGSKPDSRMTVAAQKKGISLAGSARQFTTDDFDSFDLILAMDRSNYQDILMLDTNNQHANKIKLMCSFCRTHSDEEVPDPYYGGEAGFDYVIELLIDACEGLLDSLCLDNA